MTRGKLGIVVTPAFKKALEVKPPELQAAIMECVTRLLEDPRHPSLRTHKIHGVSGVFEAYVDRANRVTFHYGDREIVLRHHCNHTIISRTP